MNTVGVIVAIIGGLVVIAGFITAVLVSARTKGQEEELERARRDRDDYKGRVEFMEPRMAAALRENEVLQQLHDPSGQLAAIKGDTATILALLKAQASDIQDAIDRAGGEHGS